MPMKDGIHLEIATAGGSVYDDMVSYVELPFSAALSLPGRRMARRNSWP